MYRSQPQGPAALTALSGMLDNDGQHIGSDTYSKIKDGSEQTGRATARNIT